MACALRTSPKSNRITSLIILSILAAFLAACPVSASPEYVGKVPNGGIHRCATCHDAGGPPELNSFGNAFFGAGEKWCPELAQADSDGDGISNGSELGDPQGVWRPGMAPSFSLTTVSLPGDKGSRPETMSRLRAWLTPVVTWLGHFHPVFVHLPIGGLLLVGLLEIVALVPGLRMVTHSRRTLLALTLGGALVSVVCGWVLSGSGSYELHLMQWHKWTGLAVAVACLGTMLCERMPWRPGYQLALWGTVSLLFVASHFGGSLTHGKDFLTLELPRHGSPLPAVHTVVSGEFQTAGH